MGFTSVAHTHLSSVQPGYHALPMACEYSQHSLWINQGQIAHGQPVNIDGEPEAWVGAG